MSPVLTCVRGDLVSWGPPSLATSTFTQCAFVCENCRCKDCSIVLDFECECGERHADRSSEDANLCIDCYATRQRIDAVLLKSREYEILQQEPLYGGSIARIEQSEREN